jgi:hypothetical protein
MFVRVDTVKQKSKVYRYARILESYRRVGDGMPVHKVLASFPDPSPLLVENLRLALRETENGRAVLLSGANLADLPDEPVLANLRYLDVAVVLHIWQEIGLPALLRKILPPTDVEIPVEDVLAALVVQRCVAPGSKLFAERWFPRTALPELLGLTPDRFNNTRIHRALDALASANDQLQTRLPGLVAQRNGAFVSLFLDVTDTWFVGRGPEVAQHGKTKEGLVRRKVGIVLLCDQDGMPLRFEIIPGKRPDIRAMTDMVEGLKGVKWIGNAPIVCDRAMGKAVSVDFLCASGFFFLTAVPCTEFAAYTDLVPYAAVADLEGQDDVCDKDVQTAVEAVEKAGMKRVSDALCVLDLEVVSRARGARMTEDQPSIGDGSMATAMELARRCGKENGNRDDLAKQLGCSKALVVKYRKLLRLADPIQVSVLAGDAEHLTLASLLEITKLDKNAHQAAYDRLRTAAPTGRKSTRRPGVSTQTESLPPAQVRGVLYFNAEMFFSERIRAREKLAAVTDFVDDLNRRLKAPNARRDVSSIRAEIDRELRKRSLLEVFRIEIVPGEAPNPRFRVEVTLNQDVWRERRRWDGFNLLVGHPDLPQSAEQLVTLFRAKDAVEKDFETIKSVVELRPVRHRTESKVRAHVMLCILALLVERTLERRLATMHTPLSAPAAIEELSSCHLNQMLVADGKLPIYSITRRSDRQNEILRALRLQSLEKEASNFSTYIPR